MVGRAYDCVSNPLGAVRFMFNKEEDPLSGGDWGVHSLFSNVLLDQEAILRVPEINSVPLHSIPSNSLVRFRGMVQDMFNVEYYVGAYKDAGTWHTTKFSDTSVLPPCLEADMKIWDRRPIYCVPVPGENTWVKNVFQSPELCTPNSQTVRDPRSHQKRGREALLPDVVDMDTDTDGTDLELVLEKRMCQGATTSTEDKSQSNGSFDFNIPLGEKNLVPCLVKVYDGFDADLKLNEVVEFIGVLTFDPMLTVHHESADDCSDSVQLAFLEEDIATQLPASKVPRLHSILHRKLSGDGLFQAMPVNMTGRINPEACPKSSFAELRNSLVGAFTELFGGDSLAAEYLLLHLLSKVHARVEPMAVGKLSLNVVESTGPGVASSLLAVMVSKAIAALLPRSYMMHLSLEYLNLKSIAPRKNYSSNRLITGDLQLADGTHLILDETSLQSGRLNEIGLQNVHFLKNLMEWQKVEYDFEFYKMEMLSDVPVLVWSTARSRLFPADVVVPLRSTRDFLQLLPDDVPKWRTYLSAARDGVHAIDPVMQKVLEEDLVAARQEDRSLGSEVFHRWLTLARLLSISYGESTLSLERWQTVRDLERRLTERVRAD